MYTQLCKDLNEEPKLNMEIQGQGRGAQKMTKEVIDYIQEFKWDGVKFQMDKQLSFIGTKIQGVQQVCDQRLKKMLDEQNKLRLQLGNLQKKDSPSYTNKDLGDLVYEKNVAK